MNRSTLLLMTAAFTVVLLSAVGTAKAKDMESRNATLDGKKVHYEIAGDGPTTLVFVHGWASDTTAWTDQMAAFKDDARVIAIDLPGHGKSEAPAEKYTMDLFARAIAAVMDDARVERAVLIGHSNGTPVVRQFYRRYPKRTQALVVVEGALKQVMPPESAQPFLEKLRAPNYREFAEQLARGVPGIDEKMQNRLVEMMGNVSQSAIVGGMEAGLDPAIWTEDKIEVPTLCIMAQSPFWTPEYEAYVRTIVPDLDYQVVEGATHFYHMEHPAAFNERLKTYLKDKRLLEYDE